MRATRSPSRFITWLAASVAMALAAVLLANEPLQLALTLVALLPLVALAIRAALRRTPSIGQAVVVATLLLLGSGATLRAALVVLIGAGLVLLLDLFSRLRSRNFLSIFPAPANLVRVERLSREELVPMGAVKVGDRISVAPGEHVPVDGRLVSISARVWLPGTTIEERQVTGEIVVAGSVARTRMLLEATQVAKNTTTAILHEIAGRVVRLTPPYVLRIERLLFWAQVVWSVGLVVVWFLSEQKELTALMSLAGVWWLGSLLSRLSWVGLLARAAHHGILVTTWEAVRRARHIRIAVLDKTGTITTGAPTVLQVMTAKDLTREDVLRVAAALEFGIDHPIARTIKRTVAAEHLAIPEAQQVAVRPSIGLEGTIEGESFGIGNALLLERWNLEPEQAMLRLAKLQESQGATIVYLVGQERVLGLLILKDVPRPSAPALIEGLRRIGVQQIQLVSGDTPLVVRSTAATLGISTTETFAHTTADRKRAHIAQLPNLEALAIGDPETDHDMLTNASLGFGFLGHGPALREPAMQVLVRVPNLLYVPQVVKGLRWVERTWWLAPTASATASVGAAILLTLAAI